MEGRKSSEAHLAAVRKYDAEHTAKLTFKAKKEIVEEFKTIAARRGETPNGLFKGFVINYVNNCKEESMNTYTLIETKRGDRFETEFEARNDEQAIARAEAEWKQISVYERQTHIEDFHLIAGKAFDDDGNDLDLNPIWEAGYHKYRVTDRQTGTVIEAVDTIGEGLKLIEEYEETDRNEGNYEPNFYDVVDDDRCSLIY